MADGIKRLKNLGTIVLTVSMIAALSACAGGKRSSGEITSQTSPAANPHEKIGQPYKVAGIWYYPKRDDGYDRTGIASWYGPKFHGKMTANGEIFDMNRLTAAHPTLPLPSIVQVTNLKNGNRVNVRVNDRGPFAHGRIIDMSREAAQKLDFKDDGLAEVRVRYIGPASMEHAVTALGQPEAYADGTYAMPKNQIVLASADGLDTVHTRIVSGPEIKSTKPVMTAEALNAESLAAVRTSVRATERSVREEIVTGGSFFEEEPESLPDFNEVMEVMGAGPADTVWMVQIGAYSSRHNAQTAASRFGKSFPVHHEQIVTSNGAPLTLVRLGPYRSADDAETALSHAQRNGFGDAHIVAP